MYIYEYIRIYIEEIKKLLTYVHDYMNRKVRTYVNAKNVNINLFI
jgi:hypothetical protein